MTGHRPTLVVSDVDGTLLTSDKMLSPRNRAAVATLAAHGVQFTLVSSRPPFGLRMLVEPLDLRMPMAALNGAVLAMPDLTVLARKPLGRDAASRALATFREFDVDAWLFTESAWYVRDAGAPYVARERTSVQKPPETVEGFTSLLDGAIKVVGVSADFDRLTRCASRTRETLGAAATAVRSQPYYLDVTAPATDKGTAVVELARRTGVDLADVTCIGDMDNDVAMFRRSGFSIAMGNGSTAARQAAKAVTGTNDADGFADAVEQVILPRVLASASAA